MVTENQSMKCINRGRLVAQQMAGDESSFSHYKLKFYFSILWCSTFIPDFLLNNVQYKHQPCTVTKRCSNEGH